MSRINFAGAKVTRINTHFACLITKYVWIYLLFGSANILTWTEDLTERTDKRWRHIHFAISPVNIAAKAGSAYTSTLSDVGHADSLLTKCIAQNIVHWKIDFLNVALKIHVNSFLNYWFDTFKEVGFCSAEVIFSIVTFNSLENCICSRISCRPANSHLSFIVAHNICVVVVVVHVTNVESKNKKPIIYLSFYASQQFNCIRAFISASEAIYFQLWNVLRHHCYSQRWSTIKSSEQSNINHSFISFIYWQLNELIV